MHYYLRSLFPGVLFSTHAFLIRLRRAIVLLLSVIRHTIVGWVLVRTVVSAVSHTSHNNWSSSQSYFPPTISTQYWLPVRTFVHIFWLIRLFSMFFPILYSVSLSFLFPHKFCRLWNFNIFFPACCLCNFFRTSSSAYYAANPFLDCFLHCCQSNLSFIFLLLLSTVLHCPFSRPYRFATG